MEYSDETLSAYIDGELPADEARSLEAEIQEDAKLAQRVENLRSVDAVLSEALSDVADEAVPEHIFAMVTDARDQSKIVSLSTARPRSWFQSPLAVAAAAAFGLAVGLVFTPRQMAESGAQIYAGSVEGGTPLYRALETLPSNTSENGLTPIVTFATSDGRVCREITGPESRALACRSSDDWTVLAVTHEVSSAGGGTYETASASASIVFDVLAQELMHDAPMSAAQEQRLLEQNWSLDDSDN